MTYSKHLIIACLSVFALPAFSQFEGLVSLTDDDKIISFDCETYEDSLLLDLTPIQGNFGQVNFERTSDPFNMRYFINGYGDSAGQGYHLFTYDLTQNDLEVTDQFFFRKIKYDPFRNSLVYSTATELINYDLSSHQHTVLTSLSIPDYLLSSVTEAYDFVHQQYLYFVDDSVGYRLVFVDIGTGAVLSNIPVAYGDMLSNLLYDYTTSTYYAINNTGSCVSLDPLTGQQTVIAHISDWNGLLNESSSAFDYSKHHFMIPYYSNSEESKLAIIDVSNSVLIADTLYPVSDANQFFGACKPPVQQTNNQLKAVYAAGYQWYKDGIPEPGETAQQYTVQGPGEYFVKVTYEGDRGAYSDTVSITDLGLAENDQINGLSASPNPFEEYTTIDLSALNGEAFTLKLYSMTGKLTYETRSEGAKSIRLEKQNLDSGMYVFSIETETGKAGTGKLAVQ